MDAFKLIDLVGHGSFTAPQLRQALENFGYFPHLNDCLLFVRRYDKTGSGGRVLYSDFCEAFCPKDGYLSKLLN